MSVTSRRDPARPTVPPGDNPAPRRSVRPVRATVLLLALAVALPVTAVLAAGIGAYHIPPAEVIGSVLDRLGSLPGLGWLARPDGPLPDQIGESVLWEVRIPRVLLALLVGSALGCAGAFMQGVFGNPLAEPGVIGISSGAAVGAILVIFSGMSVLGYWTLIASAFVFGLLTTMFVYVFARADGRTEAVTLLLTGIAVNALAGAAIGMMTNFSSNAEIQSITFWQLGSVATANWPKVWAILPCVLAGFVAVPIFARKLDLLALGERPARHLGVNVERMRFWLIVAMALLTSAAVAFAGIVGFVGLVVPHIMRMIAGPGHRVLLPASILGGGLLLVAADLFARTVVAPIEIPLGVVTALIGGPFFFWLLRRARTRQGGWA